MACIGQHAEAAKTLLQLGLKDSEDALGTTAQQHAKKPDIVKVFECNKQDAWVHREVWGINVFGGPEREVTRIAGCHHCSLQQRGHLTHTCKLSGKYPVMLDIILNYMSLLNTNTNVYCNPWRDLKCHSISVSWIKTKSAGRSECNVWSLMCTNANTWLKMLNCDLARVWPGVISSLLLADCAAEIWESQISGKIWDSTQFSRKQRKNI